MQNNCQLQQGHNEGTSGTPSPHCTTTANQESEFTSTAILASHNSYLAGYQDCMEEAMRYLAEVENIPQTDPLVVGLQQHLVEQKKLLAANIPFSQNVFHWDGGHNFSFYNNPEAVDSMVVPQTHNNMSYGFNSETSAIQESTVIPDHVQPSSSSASSSSSQQELHSRIYAELSKLSDLRTNVSDDEEMNGDDDDDEYDSCSDEEDLDNGQDPFSEYAYQLALLVQNNPSMAGLTEELLALLGNVSTEHKLETAATTETQTSGNDCY
ncbi:uncharacterized protein LOC106165940 isoform X2 [Lingula anatina]|nr:uncharacterized protein LOC106165940 isoform X2 [Lingula anatina]|eukprot:XP_013399756.1 uncharacterized protein LOC106165940 isoform X2 [Lingula anatina]